MTICGLWHGAAWNFAVWGFYHGIGLATSAGLQRAFSETTPGPVVSFAGWLATMIFVSVGWLLFFTQSIRRSRSQRCW